MRALYRAPDGQLGIVDDPRLGDATERHKLTLTVASWSEQGEAVAVLRRHEDLRGLVLEMYVGWAGRDTLILIRSALASGRRVWLYWPREQAVEHVDRERVASLWRHWLFVTAGRFRIRWQEKRIIPRLRAVLRDVPPARLPGWLARRLVRAVRDLAAGSASAGLPDDSRVRAAAERQARLDALIAAASPVPFPALPCEPGPDRPVTGCGVYLRTDFWAPIQSGGSYGHTCYVAKELAAVTESFICFMAHRYPLLDDYGVRQVALDPPAASASEDDIVSATPSFHRMLRPAFEALRPAYLYERLCLGNYAGALLSQTLGIPYIVEYNGSEISMRRSFDGVGYDYEEEYLKAEAFAFKQATMISAVSSEVRNSLVARGVDPGKILVNPNGADLSAYAPAGAAEKASIRADLGISSEATAIGFTGTFGGWHGVDVLADAMPLICARAPHAHFLLIGDGNYKHLIDQAVSEHGLEARVTAVGRVPQAEGARLLKACDIYVSPHNSHMIDSKFFGSPTKIFEYMAMGGGIVASDLEQIGESLSPALHVRDLADPGLRVTSQRAVLCVPGSVDEFVDAVVGLVERPDLWAPLGHNARAAVERHYSWTRHVARLWPFAAGVSEAVAPTAAAVAGSTPAPVRAPQVETGDGYKDEVQRQWDNDPAGSHYVKAAEPHTLDWFEEAEAYRYGEYAPWMAGTMEFARHAGERVLEIGGGMGTDLSQFARHGALVTDLDLSSGHLALARENFTLRGLPGAFVLHDAESLVFDDDMFDVVYSNGVLHHTPNTRDVVREIRRVLKPGGRAIVMMYAENSLHYWRNLVWAIGLKEQQLQQYSMGEIMSRAVERSDNASARPLVKVYTKARLRHLFEGFDDIHIVQRQMVSAEVPRLLTRVPLASLGRLMGWNLIIKARKPR